jgi:ABC-2 type transport system ATP-binding protein
MELKIQKINKSFSGKQILFDVSFDVSSAKAMGFLGRNGAGKTTTIRALMDVFKPDSGSFLLDGKPFDPAQIKVGYLPEERGLYGKEPIGEQLKYFAKLKGATNKEATQSITYWLERFGLSYAYKHKLETLSKGNQQKIQIAQALLNDPEIIILDEPFSGLDPVNSQVLKDVISEKIQQSKIVIFSSHQMSYVEEFCDEITLIDQGKIVLSGSLSAIKQQMGNNRIRIRSMNIPDQELVELFRRQPFTKECFNDRQSAIIELNQNLNSNNFLQQCMSLGIEVDSFMPYYPSLHDIFVMKVGEYDEAN